MTPTDGYVRGAVGLQEAVKVLPGLGHPVDDLHQIVAPRAPIDLRLDQLPPQEAAEETLDWLSVVGAQHPPAARGQMMDVNKAPKWSRRLNMYLSLQLKEGRAPHLSAFFTLLSQMCFITGRCNNATFLRMKCSSSTCFSVLTDTDILKRPLHIIELCLIMFFEQHSSTVFFF